MTVSFDGLQIGTEYSRNELARQWGYGGFQALARGVVTPKDDNKIILFVTHEKQSASEQYHDEMHDGVLHWEGPTDHFAEDRIIHAAANGDEIHLFFRDRHHSDFAYHGLLQLASCEQLPDHPSKFVFHIIG